MDEATVIRGISQFVNGDLWAAGDAFVARSSDGGQSWTVMGSDGDKLGVDIQGLVQDAEGKVWAGAYDGGISVFDGEQWRHLQR